MSFVKVNVDITLLDTFFFFFFFFFSLLLVTTISATSKMGATTAQLNRESEVVWEQIFGKYFPSIKLYFTEHFQTVCSGYL
jgi:hypothetical protein